MGAAEIRHILICMGELITDEEIDMMIQMVDFDGDGQVLYHPQAKSRPVFHTHLLYYSRSATQSFGF